MRILDVYKKHKASGIGGGDKGTDHSYIEMYYDKVFESLKTENLNILEIGIHLGYSLRMWREFFVNANITGVDIEDNRIQCPGCNLIYGDATKSQTFKEIGQLDIVIDDGSHKLQHQLESFKILFPKLKPGGIYIIEDVFNLDRDRKYFLELSNKVQIYDFRHLKNRWDDVIIEVRK